MSMRIFRLPVHLQPEEAHTLLQFIDQLRDELMFHYANDIATMLKQASTRPVSAFDVDDDPLP
jgi:hypothetical protein